MLFMGIFQVIKSLSAKAYRRRQASVVGRLLFDMIDDEDRFETLADLKLQPQLLFQCLKERDAAGGG
jgi:hypothetical protein